MTTTNEKRADQAFEGIDIVVKEVLELIDDEHDHATRKLCAFAIRTLLEREERGHSYLDYDTLAALNSDGDPNQIKETLLKAKPLFGQDQASAILCLEHALVLQKHFVAATSIAKRLEKNTPHTHELLQQAIKKTKTLSLSEEQERALTQALTHKFSLIQGGPGTGKTSTVLGILLAANELGIQRIVLAAPTGKASDRMASSVRSRMAAFTESEQHFLDTLPFVTIHRLLGASSFGFRKNEQSLLEADMVIVDESSMLDLETLHALLRACPEKSSIVFIGDPKQLQSIGAGAVLRDLSNFLHPSELTKSYRVDPSKAQLTELFDAIRQNQSEDSVALLHERVSYSACTHSGIEITDSITTKELKSIAQKQRAGQQRFVLPREEEQLKQELQNAQQTKIISPLRRGRIGTNVINETLRLNAKELIPGEPVIITKNDYGAEVYNGDEGLIVDVKDSKGTSTRVFATLRGQDIKLIPLTSLNHGTNTKVEAGYAITVHKAQGSEYDEVIFVLPTETPIFSSLLYTALTRAKKSVVVIGEKKNFANSVELSQTRDTYLGQLSTT